MAEDIRKRQNFSSNNLERATQLGKKQSERKHPNCTRLNQSTSPFYGALGANKTIGSDDGDGGLSTLPVG